MAWDISMARAYQQSQPSFERDQGPAEWQSLRDELVALLDQVDGQVARSGRETPLSERVRDLRHQVTAADQDAGLRHRDALRTVQRQISRFEDPAPAQPAPRDSLQAAISQIRANHGAPRQPAPAPTPAAPPRNDGPLLERLAQAVTGLGGRLERLEGEIQAQVRAGGNVKDVADQVAQLAHVVELLAGAVGETGQVKRLEGQIASLGRIMSQGRETDLTAITRRLDDVASTVGKLAELQVHFTERVQNPLELDAFREGMRSIEDSVRGVYDRIDALERQRSLAPQDLEIVTSEMARFTAALQDHNQPSNLVELVDALNMRIADIESGDRLLLALREDLGMLREAVAGSMAPRFDAIEHQLGALSAEVGTRADMAEIGRQIGALGDRIGERSVDSGIGQIEAQVRQLVARMDQTGEQLAGLARLYSEPAQTATPEIDFDAVADMVASRAAEAMARQTPDASLGDKIGALEERIVTMLRDMPQNDGMPRIDGMKAGIDEVNERLQRLETSLLQRAAASATVGLTDSLADAAPADEIAIETAPSHAPRAARDTMPHSPVDDAPLTAPPFPDPAPEIRPLARRHHPGLEVEDVPLADRHEEKPPKRAPGLTFEPPPPPTPSAPFIEPTSPAAAPEGAAPRASTNTFIEAARRMSQRQPTPAAAPAGAPGSLIGRALSRFQTAEAATDAAAEAAPIVDRQAEKATKPKRERAPRVLAGDKPARKIFKAEPAAAFAPQSGAGLDRADEPGFLARHRRPILLAALLVGVSLLAANLVIQRMGNAPAPAEPAPISTGDIEGDVPMEALPDAAATPLTASSTAPVAPRVIEMTDSITTGAIDQAAAHAFTSAPLPAMPSAFTAASDLAKGGTIAPLAPVSPVKVELPPEGVGPAGLRQAAADGDVRAQFEVAAIFTEGRAVPQDYKAAAVWYERAAAAGFAPAQYRLGALYESGDGVDKDAETAKLWYERAAEAGNRMAMHNLAALYAGGGLGAQEFDSAARWFEEAASRGLTDSQFNLGMLYARGLGVPQSLEDSYKWFGIAARNGDADAAKARDDMARSLDSEAMTRLADIVNNFKPAPVDLRANFAPIGTWSGDFDPGEAIASRDIVTSVQKALDKLGYDVGTPDGIAGTKTQTAIKLFEQATGMSEVGQINPRLLAVLGSQPV